jgi:glycosyltransferase involved in cell wall biosynthesis
MLTYKFYLIKKKPKIIAFQRNPKLVGALINSQIRDLTALIYLSGYHAKPHRILRLYKNLFRLKLNNVDPILVCNDPKEDIWRRLLGIRGFLSTIYVYVDENKFQIKERDKKYDAVYIAQMLKVKRIELAKDIKRLYVLTYNIGQNVGGFDLYGFCPAVRHADFNRSWINIEEKNNILNSARVGLALSREEGAMLGSFEYMLCGLPVVSTESRGGRDQYYNNDFCLIVKDTPEAIRSAVEEMISRNINPIHIRKWAIDRVNKDRDKHVDYICDYFRKEKGIKLDSYKLRKDMFDKPGSNCFSTENIQQYFE